VVALTKLVGFVVGWLARNRRRQVAVLVLPLLAAVALLAPRGAGSPGPGAVLAGRPEPPAGAETGSGAPGGTPPPTVPSAAGLPGTTGAAPGPTVPTRPAAVLPPEAVRLATAYVSTANAHDARPGKDRGFLDSYRRARPYLTPELFALVSAPSRRGDYQWEQWQRAQATVAVKVQRVAVPDGAPLPTAATVYVRVQFLQVVTPHLPGAAGGAVSGAVSLVATRGGDQKWRVSQLLAGT
jgi:hypothetical protein